MATKPKLSLVTKQQPKVKVVTPPLPVPLWECVVEPSFKDPVYRETLRRTGKSCCYSVFVEARSERAAKEAAKKMVYEHSAIVRCVKTEAVLEVK